MPKSKRNKTVDLSKTKKHGLDGKKELYRKIQSNVESYAHVFVFAVNDMRNSKMKNIREKWKHSRFCIGKNKVMALALGRTREEEFRPNLHKIGQMLVGERGLLFTNQSVEEVTNWFQSYSEADYARSGNIATEDVVLPEGPLVQFPHNLESYLRQLGLPTTLKKGVIHLIKEHVVCTEGERLSPETARILKLLGYEMAEFRVKILSFWSQDGSFINLQSDSCDPDYKENVASPPKSFMRDDFELVKDCLLLGDDDEMEIAEGDSDHEIETVKLTQKSFPKAEDGESLEIIPCDLDDKQESEAKSSSKKKLKKSFIEVEEKDCESLEIIPSDLDEKQEAEKTKSISKKKGKKSFIEAGEKDDSDNGYIEIIPTDLVEKEPAKQNSKKDEEKSTNKEKQSDVNQPSENTDSAGKTSSEKEIFDTAAILKVTKKKLQESAEKPKKFSPKMTRARAAASGNKIKTPEPLETKRSSRKRKM